MNQTFNLAILNNSFANTAKNKSGAYEDAPGMATTANSAAIRSYQSESIAPFTIKQGVKVPDISEYRRDDREERQATLQKRPKHKEVATIDEKLMSAALTM